VCCFFNVGKSREITPSGVPSFLLLESGEITSSGVLAVELFGSQRSQEVVC
jgi:hypothetical protein